MTVGGAWRGVLGIFGSGKEQDEFQKGSCDFAQDRF
jgi:hypothetical protein